jgi:hypothetical protein
MKYVHEHVAVDVGDDIRTGKRESIQLTQRYPYVCVIFSYDGVFQLMVCLRYRDRETSIDTENQTHDRPLRSLFGRAVF